MSDSHPASDLSETITNQRNERTCAYHASSKVVVQNVFQFFIPRKIDVGVYRASECNRFVDFDIYKTDISTLTPELCSPGGYERILQFLYVYHLIYDKLSTTETGFKSGSYHSGRDVLPDIWAGKIPAYFDDKVRHRNNIVEMLKEVNRQRTVFDIHYVNFEITLSTKTANNEFEFVKRHKMLFDVVKRFNNKGLYMYVSLRGKKQDEDIIVDGVKHSKHAVHIVSTHNGEVIIKNSWGDGRVYSMKLYGSVFLHGQHEYAIERITFLMPVKTSCEPVYPVLNLMDPNFQVAMTKLENILERCVPHYGSIKELAASPVFRRGELVTVLGTLGVFLEYGRQHVNVEIPQGKRTVDITQPKKPVVNDSFWKQVRDLRLEQIVARLAANDASNYVEHKAALAKLSTSQLAYEKLFKERADEKYLLQSRLGDIGDNEKKIRVFQQQIVTNPGKKDALEQKIAECEKKVAFHEAIAKKKREIIERLETKLKLNPGPSSKTTQTAERNVTTLETKMNESKDSLAYLNQFVKSAPVATIKKPAGFRDVDMDEDDDDDDADHGLLEWVATIGLRGEDRYKVWGLFQENGIRSVNEPRKDYLRYIASLVSHESRQTLDNYFHLFDERDATKQPEKVPPKPKSPQTHKKSPEKKTPQTLKAKSPEKKEFIVIDSDDEVTVAPRGASPVKPFTNGYFNNGVFKPVGSAVSSSWVSGFKDANNYFFEVTDVL